MFLLFKLLLMLFGLTIPGYVTVRTLRMPCSWALSFPISAVLMTECLVMFSIIGIPLRLNTVGFALCAWVVLCLLILRFRMTVPDVITVAVPARPEGRLDWVCIGIAVLTILAVALRSTLYPLSGFDTFFRWESLARQMLFQESLNFYPPVSPADFSIYLIPDGIPPLVSTVYWWLYAAVGKPVVQITSVSVTLQLLSAMALTFYGTSQAFGSRAGYLSLLVFSASSLLITGFAIGQETGFTALSVAGQFLCAQVALRRPGVSPVIAVALLAAVGAMARDYGPALASTGFLVLASDVRTRRYLVHFMVMTVLLFAPWYLRNWAITGNPLYPHSVFGIFPVNYIYESPQTILKASSSFYHYSFRQWLAFLGVLIAGAPLAILGGLPYGCVKWRKSAPLLVAVGLPTLLWLVSMGVTGDAGVTYSMFLLTPALLASAILAGAAGSVLCGYSHKVASSLKYAVVSTAILCSLYAMACSFSHPFAPESILSSITYRHSGPPEFCADSKVLAADLQSSQFPPTGVVTTSAYIGTILQQDTRFRPVMAWNPEVRFVFDRGLTVSEIQRRLVAMNIRMVYLESGDNKDSRFLGQFPFFQVVRRGNVSEGVAMIAAEGSEAMFYLADNK